MYICLHTDIACGLSQPTEIDWAPGNIINPVSLPAQCTWRFTSSLGKVTACLENTQTLQIGNTNVSNFSLNVAIISMMSL